MVGSSAGGSAIARSLGRPSGGSPVDAWAGPGTGSRSKARSGAGSGLVTEVSSAGGGAAGRGAAVRGAGSGPTCDARGDVASLAGTILPRPSVSLTADTPDNSAPPTTSDARSAIADTSVLFRGPRPCVQLYHAPPVVMELITITVMAARQENAGRALGVCDFDSFFAETASRSGKGAIASRVRELAGTFGA